MRGILLSERVEAARRELEFVRPGAWSAGEPAMTGEGRAIVEYTCDGGRVIGKLFADVDPARGGARLSARIGGDETFQRQEWLAGLGTPTLRVPRAVVWCAVPRVLVTEAASGRACRTIPACEWPDVMPRIGRALRELHEQPLWPGLELRLRDHMNDLIRPAPAEIAKAFPQHADIVNRTLERLRAADEGWGELPMTWLHRDFHMRQLFDDGEHVTVIDWDDLAFGDAAFDVGYFTAYLKTHHAASDAETGIAAFRSGYGGDDALWSRVPDYERFNFLRRACRRLRLRDQGWEHELAAKMARLDD